MNSSRSDDPALDAGLAAAFAPDGTGAYQSRGETAESVGTVIAGKYKLLELIGEGGMGSVWMAQQTEPVTRLVAVKLIKTGMDSKTVLARFEAERQALAVMDHPNIAKILDGGVTGEPGASATGVSESKKTPVADAPGSPFFVMELVKGVPITKYCDEHKLTPKQRLELFVPVCQAIQHAHQKGIIHRDIKPSNVMVALYDDKPVPKIIDFGVAKAAGQSLTEETLHTGFGGVVGTPEYMSPEQATLNNLDIDTRSDIYSLGVLLYELLAGSPPFKHMDLEKAGLLEMLRVIREDEPPRPSAKLSTADALPSLSASRGTEPKKLTGILRNELDWIVMKALEKDRARRYETANGFAADINRYLAGEPVNAYPPSTAYRMRKFLRKNKGPVIAASLVALTLICGIVGTSIGLVWANRERADAIAARNAEAEQKSIAEAEKQKAEKAEDATLKDYRASTDDAVFQLIGSKQEIGPQERAYLENTLKRWQAFANRVGNDERSQDIRAQGHSNVAALWTRLGRNEDALKEYRAESSILKRLVEQFPNATKYRECLAGTHSNMGVVLSELERPKEARTADLAAFEIRKELAAQFPNDPDYQAALGDSHNNLGTSYGHSFEREAARREYQESLAIRKKLVEKFPRVRRYQETLVECHVNLGATLLQLGLLEEARAQLAAACRISQDLVRRFPDEPKCRLLLAGSRGNLAILLHKLAKDPEADVEYRAANEIAKKLVDQYPAVPEYQRYLRGGHMSFGERLLDTKDREEARKQFEMARDVGKGLVRLFPSSFMDHHLLAKCHTTLGTLGVELRQNEQARTEFEASIGVLKKLVELVPHEITYKLNLGSSYHNLGQLMRLKNKGDESFGWYGLAIETLTPVNDKKPGDRETTQTLIHSHAERAMISFRKQKFTEAVNDWDRAIALGGSPKHFDYCLKRTGARLLAQKNEEAAAEVSELMKTEKWTAAQWFAFASIFAMNGGEKTDGDAAMQLLHKAVKEGFTDADELKKNKNFAPLRNRDDFQKLLAELESKSRPA